MEYIVYIIISNRIIQVNCANTTKIPKLGLSVKQILTAALGLTQTWIILKAGFKFVWL